MVMASSTLVKEDTEEAWNSSGRERTSPRADEPHGAMLISLSLTFVGGKVGGSFGGLRVFEFKGDVFGGISLVGWI